MYLWRWPDKENSHSICTWVCLYTCIFKIRFLLFSLMSICREFFALSFGVKYNANLCINRREIVIIVNGSQIAENYVRKNYSTIIRCMSVLSCTLYLYVVSNVSRAFLFGMRTKWRDSWGTANVLLSSLKTRKLWVG